MTSKLTVAAVLAIALSTGAGLAVAQGQPAAGVPATPAAAGTIGAPDTVDAGQVVNVVVEGAPQGSTIEIWGPVTEAGGGDRIRSVPLVGGTAGLVAPIETGSYQLRYLGPDGGRTLARAAFDVAAVPIALSVLTPAQPGGDLEVEWQGPASPGDRFEIVGPSGAVVEATPVAGDASTANASTLTAPTEVGAYQLRYVSGRGAVLRAVGFEVR